jgi:methanogenic corrinoid protein MtbC1
LLVIMFSDTSKKPSTLNLNNYMEESFNKLKDALVEFDAVSAQVILTEQLKKNKEQVPELITRVLSAIGDEWERGELALSQVYMSGTICEKLADELFKVEDAKIIGQPAIGIVTFNDYHSLGKKIVSSVLKSVGFRLTDLGSGLTPRMLVQKIASEDIHILLVSVLMLPSALKVKELKSLLAEANYNIKIMVGGAPFNFDNQLWQQVGADAMGKNPSDAVEILHNWIKQDAV